MGEKIFSLILRTFLFLQEVIVFSGTNFTVGMNVRPLLSSDISMVGFAVRIGDYQRFSL